MVCQHFFSLNIKKVWHECLTSAYYNGMICLNNKIIH